MDTNILVHSHRGVARQSSQLAAHAARGHASYVVAHAYLAGITAIQGEPEHTRLALAHARRIEHPHSLGYALGFASMQCQLLNDYSGARRDRP